MGRSNRSAPHGGAAAAVFLAAFVLTQASRADDATATPAATQPSPSATPAAGAPPVLKEVVVTANRNANDAAELGSSVTVITGQEIQQKQQPLVADVLRNVPSLDVVRSGGPNQITSVFTRGANSAHTLVLIDGIEANDPTSPARAFDFSTLTVDDVDRIEVIRGPQSTLWGSNAIGGVINIITKRGQGPLTGYLYGEAGSFNTYRESAGLSGGDSHVDYSFNITQANSQGFSAADAKYGNREADGFNDLSLAGRFGVRLSENFDIDLIARYQHNRVKIDDGGGPGGDDPNRLLESDQTYLRVQPRLVLFDGVLVQTYGLNYTAYLRNDNFRLGPTQDDGNVLKFDFQNDIHIGKANLLSAGVDVAEEAFSATDSPQHYADSVGVYLQDQFAFQERLFLTGGVRYEDHSIGGSSLTYRFTGAYLFPTNTRLHGSYGTGFKSPTLFDLFSAFGSPDLKPEKSIGWDAGVQQTFADGRISVDATYFNNHFTDLIDFDFVANREQNVGEARSDGVELSSTFRPTDTVSLGVNYTYTNTEDETTHLQLLRRPRNKVGGSITWKYTPRGTITLSGTYVGSRADGDPVTFNRIRLGGYTLVDLATAYKITDHLEATARIDNLLNQHYQEVAGFGTADISFYAGLKLSF